MSESNHTRISLKSDSKIDKGKVNEGYELKTSEAESICIHCERTPSNGKKCKGICVADSDY